MGWGQKSCRASGAAMVGGEVIGWNGVDLLWRKRIHTRTDDTGEGGRDDSVEGEKTGQWEQLELTTSKWEETGPGTEALFTSDAHHHSVGRTSPCSFLELDKVQLVRANKSYMIGSPPRQKVVCLLHHQRALSAQVPVTACPWPSPCNPTTPAMLPTIITAEMHWELICRRRASCSLSSRGQTPPRAIGRAVKVERESS